MTPPKQHRLEIGGMMIEPDDLHFIGSDPYNAVHKFVVAVQEDLLRIFVSIARSHYEVRNAFKLKDEDIVGGGSVYIDRSNILHLGDYSADYNTIPKDIAEEFAQKIAELIRDTYHVQVDGTCASTTSNLNKYWKK